MSEKPSNDFRVKWYRTEIPKERLAELNSRSDAKGFLQSMSYLTLLVLSGFSVFYVHQNFTWPWLLLSLFIHGNICAFQINAVHELSHGTVFKTKGLNTLFIRIFSFFGGHNYHYFRASHSRHHRNTLHFPHDSEIVLPITYTVKGFLSSAFINPSWFKFQVGQHLRFSVEKFVGDWEVFLMEDPALRASVRNASRSLIAGHLAIIFISLYYGLWIIPVITTLVPFYGNFLHFFLNNSQHVGLRDNVDDFRLCCRTIRTNPLFRYLYWHMNWHIEHHMYAAVPCYNLKKLHREIRHELPPTPNGIIPAWRGIAKILARQKQDNTYQYTAELPGPALAK